MKPYLKKKNPITKRAGGVAHSVGLEFSSNRSTAKKKEVNILNADTSDT
jgi:hypothetical protein